MPAAVVLLHGLRTSATMWRHQVEALESAGIPVLAVDLPGHGSRIAERFTLESALRVIGETVAEAQERTGEKPYLVGFSLGGYLGIDWVAGHPDRVCGLLAASCGTVPHRLLLGGWRYLARVIHAFPDRGRRLNDTVVRIFVPEPGATDVLVGGVALEVMEDVLTALPTLRPLHSLRRIDIPILFVNGALDHIRLHAEAYLRASTAGRLVTVPRATHMVSVTHPEVFTRLLLEGHAAASGPASHP